MRYSHAIEVGEERMYNESFASIPPLQILGLLTFIVKLKLDLDFMIRWYHDDRRIVRWYRRLIA